MSCHAVCCRPGCLLRPCIAVATKLCLRCSTAAMPVNASRHGGVAAAMLPQCLHPHDASHAILWSCHVMPCHAWQPHPSPLVLPLHAGHQRRKAHHPDRPNLPRQGLRVGLRPGGHAGGQQRGAVAPGLCGHSLHSCYAGGWVGLPGGLGCPAVNLKTSFSTDGHQTPAAHACRTSSRLTWSPPLWSCWLRGSPPCRAAELVAAQQHTTPVNGSCLSSHGWVAEKINMSPQTILHYVFACVPHYGHAMPPVPPLPAHMPLPLPPT